MKLIFTGPDPQSPHLNHSGGQLTATVGFAEFARAHDIIVYWVDTLQTNFPVPPLAERLSRAGCRLVRFARLAARGEVDGAIIFTGAGLSFLERSLMALMARALGVPSLLMIRDGNFERLYDRSRLFRLLVRPLLRLPDRIGVQGESWRPFLTAAGVPRERIAVIPNWLNRPPRLAARSGPASDILKVAFVGWLTIAKGVPELIKAIRMLARSGTAAHLTLVGGGDLLETCQLQATEPDLSHYMTVTGWLPVDGVEAVLAGSDVVVLPSHAEGFPNVVMEAMAQGLPVIATPVGAIPDSVVDGVNGVLVPVRSPQAIRDAIAAYAADRSRLAAHSKRALETARTMHDRSSNCRKALAALGLELGDLPSTGL